MQRRSNAPFFWLLFGAGGTLSALLGPVLVVITGIALPLSWVSITPEYLSVLAFTRHWLVKLFVFMVIALFSWHAAHRIFHSLHDIEMHTGPLAKIMCYGSALLISIVTAWYVILV